MMRSYSSLLIGSNGRRRALSLSLSLLTRRRWLSNDTNNTNNTNSNTNDTNIRTILVANRGEIACRVIRTARRLGLRTVAVFSDADRHALHVRLADQAVRLGPAPSRLSYLDASAVIQAALRSGAQAVHPGYGFLSESAQFAQRCEEEGLLLVGPPASAIRDMGDKSASKTIMAAAGVPLVPGYHGPDQRAHFLRAQAEQIGFPLLIKPTHGGGGKGMRVVHRAADFLDSLQSARREAAASFGVDTVLLEKYITEPRHVEVQVFGDKLGNVIHLYERDCSLQRRHQKIIEEAPAPNVSHLFRSQIGQAAVSAAKAVAYYSAGTVEFIVDTASHHFYFMEMNTRLQVEHPVTEMVVGQDLVEWQIRVANGEPLPLTQDQVSLNGHAFEARIYAENVPRGFLPATGTLHHYRPVDVTPTVRVETGVEEGDTVTVHYDPMIAKLVVWGQNRAAALLKLKSCLSDFQIAGLPTNVSFLRDLASHWAFQKGQVETHFIEHYKDDLLTDSAMTATNEPSNASKLSAMLASACLCHLEHISSSEAMPCGDRLVSLWYANPPFRMHHSAKTTVEFDWDKDMDGSFEGRLKLAITHQTDGGYFIEIEDGHSSGLEVKVLQSGDNNFRVEAGGLQTDVTVAHYFKDHNKYIHVWHGDHHQQFRQTKTIRKISDDGSHLKPSFAASSHQKGIVVAPMAGLVIKVLVDNGAQVEEGQPILVLEAMKMEHVVKSPRPGIVDGLKVTSGQQVFDSTVLFNIKGDNTS
ncbi:Methylcrotonoyl-CoA carboxylase subunit alpha [Rhynchospora pubera]|uniref:Methylcrotonoyl-CoA carboxylase subunit alpha n=1 Tax=Rhynchospora pubera TaxID=906938 RepID=A0AAV8EXL8_9POAL|nr:Methylcrotonoyl-CoA carboxylase subunit alpha [Rhynchospora pubera]